MASSGSAATATANSSGDAATSGGGRASAVSGGGRASTVSGGGSGIPGFAGPWIELGKLEEREKWQALAVQLVEASVASEFAELKRGVADALPPRLPELKSRIHERVDESHLKISRLIAEYRKLLFAETNPYADQKQATMIHALQQYQACGLEETIPGMIEELTTASVTEEIVMVEEPPPSNVSKKSFT